MGLTSFHPRFFHLSGFVVIDDAVAAIIGSTRVSRHRFNTGTSGKNISRNRKATSAVAHPIRKAYAAQSKKSCKPPMCCRIGAPHWRFCQEQSGSLSPDPVTFLLNPVSRGDSAISAPTCRDGSRPQRHCARCPRCSRSFCWEYRRRPVRGRMGRAMECHS